MYIYKKKKIQWFQKRKKINEIKSHSDCTPPTHLLHFFLAKRLNFFSLSFLVGGGSETLEEGRVWALAPEGPAASSAARGRTAFSMAWLQRWSSSWFGDTVASQKHEMCMKICLGRGLEQVWWRRRYSPRLCTGTNIHCRLRDWKTERERDIRSNSVQWEAGLFYLKWG